MRGGGTSQIIEELLNKEDTTLEDLLNEDDLLQECKTLNNNKLITLYLPCCLIVLLCRSFSRDRIYQLVKYITEMPPEDATHQRGHKYPFLCSEILNCEIGAVIDAFFVKTFPQKAVVGVASANDEKNESEDPDAAKKAEKEESFEEESAESQELKEATEVTTEKSDEASGPEEAKEPLSESKEEELAEQNLTEEVKQNEASAGELPDGANKENFSGDAT